MFKADGNNIVKSNDRGKANKTMKDLSKSIT